MEITLPKTALPSENHRSGRSLLSDSVFPAWERSRGTAVAVGEPELLLQSAEGPCTEPKLTEEENKGNSPPGAQALQRGMPSFQFCVAWGKDLLLGLGYLLLMMGPVAIELVEVMHEGIYGKG